MKHGSVAGRRLLLKLVFTGMISQFPTPEVCMVASLLVSRFGGWKLGGIAGVNAVEPFRDRRLQFARLIQTFPCGTDGQEATGAFSR